MIPLKEARIHWRQGWSNPPSLCLVLDRAPKRSDLVWKQHPNHFIGNREDGLLAFLAHDGSQRNLGGMGGDALTLNMHDGSTRTIRGPWSSSPDTVLEETGVSLVSVSVKGLGRGCYLAGFALSDEDFRAVVEHLGYQVAREKYSRLVPSLSADQIIKPAH